jgi:5-methylcytosine-specific restriction endonuclease McrA
MIKRTPIKRKTPLRSKKPEPRTERIPLTILRPGEVKKEVEVEHIFRDGRTKINQNCKEGRDLYQSRKRIAWEAQGKLCAICHKTLAFSDSQVDHKEPRGMGAGKIDDRQENIQAVHPICNSRKGSIRDFEDVD